MKCFVNQLLLTFLGRITIIISQKNLPNELLLVVLRVRGQLHPFRGIMEQLRNILGANEKNNDPSSDGFFRLKPKNTKIESLIFAQVSYFFTRLSMDSMKLFRLFWIRSSTAMQIPFFRASFLKASAPKSEIFSNRRSE